MIESDKKKAMLCSSILIDFFRGDKSTIEKAYEYMKTYNFELSPLAYYEFLRGSFNNKNLSTVGYMYMYRGLSALTVKSESSAFSQV